MRILMYCILGLTSALAWGVELTSATNDQLLGEVARRMQGGDGGGISVASYTCHSSGYLYIHLVSPSGVTKEAYYTTPNYNRCLEQVGPLNAHKSKIRETTVIAVCDSSGYLYRVPLTPTGTIGTATYMSTANYDACLAQAKLVNG